MTPTDQLMNDVIKASRFADDVYELSKCCFFHVTRHCAHTIKVMSVIYHGCMQHLFTSETTQKITLRDRLKLSRVTVKHGLSLFLWPTVYTVCVLDIQ